MEENENVAAVEFELDAETVYVIATATGEVTIETGKTKTYKTSDPVEVAALVAYGAKRKG